MATKIRVLLADDHQIILHGLEAILEKEETIEVVGTALDGVQALSILQRSEVDVAVLDLRMPRMDGLETMKRIKVEYPNVKVLALSMHKETTKIKELIEAGVKGYILKNRGRKDLLEGIKALMAGKTFWGEEIAQSFLDSIYSEPNQAEQNVTITDMERQVLELIAEGMTSKEIADKLCRAPSTIETHKTNLKSKLNIKNEKLLVRYAVENGYVLKAEKGDH